MALKTGGNRIHAIAALITLITLGGGRPAVAADLFYTLKGGYSAASDTAKGASLGSNAGYAVGGGFMARAFRSTFVEFEVLRTESDGELGAMKVDSIRRIEGSLGLQVRAERMTVFTPYFGAGGSAIATNISDTSLSGGGYLKAGLDLPLSSTIALNLEVKETWATGIRVEQEGNSFDYNPSALVGTIGVRLLY